MSFQEIRPTPLDERVLGCTFGNYPWDEWEWRRAWQKNWRNSAGR